jgi:hypothetical protein
MRGGVRGEGGDAETNPFEVIFLDSILVGGKVRVMLVEGEMRRNILCYKRWYITEGNVLVGDTAAGFMPIKCRISINRYAYRSPVNNLFAAYQFRAEFVQWI